MLYIELFGADVNNMFADLNISNGGNYMFLYIS